MEIQTVLVTGSSGMIGTAVCEHLRERDIDVVGVDWKSNRWSDETAQQTINIDLRDRDEITRLPDDVDLIIHLAANARVHQLVQNPERARDNFEALFSTLEYARRVSPVGIVFGSSREVYGNDDDVVHAEDELSVERCESPYTASKIGSEAMVKAYEQCYDIDACILRFSNVFGKYDTSNRVVPRFIAQAHRGEPLTVYGGSKILDFTYIDDCLDGIVRTVENFRKVKGRTLNIASGEGTSLVELAEEITNRVPRRSEIIVEENRPGEIEQYIGDISRAEKLIGYAPTHSISDGIEKTIDWYQSEELIHEISK